MSKDNNNQFGLKLSTINQIQQVFKRHPEIEQVLLYGSRAKGNYRNGSDIDLTLIGDRLNYKQLNRIETEIDELLLPYSLDLSILAHIDNSELLSHIQRVGLVFYSKNARSQ